MKMHRWLYFVIICLAVGGPIIPSSGMDIVRDNRPCTSIVIPDNPTPAIEFAATELQYHINRSTGAVLPIVKEISQPTGTGLIYLGNCRRTLEVGIDGQKCAPNGFIIRLIGEDLFLCGHDSAGEPLGNLHNNYTRVGTLFSVYELLETTMGIKWLWPGELGAVMPKKSNLVIEKYNKTWEPGIVSKRWRSGEGYWGKEGWSSKDARGFYLEEESKWLRRHRFALGVNIDMGHSYGDYWGRFGKGHPEYFNLLPDGARKPDPYFFGGEPTLISMNVSEPGLWKQKVSDWESKGGSGWICASENDTAGKCICEKCLSWDEPDAELDIPFEKRLEYAKVAFEKRDADWVRYLGSISDRYGKYYLAVQKEAEKTNPNAVVAGYAYANYSKPPTNVKLNDRIIIGIVPSMFPWTEQKMKQFYTQWDGWRATGAREILRPNYTLDGYCFPIFYADKLGLQISHAVKNGLIAADFDSLTGQWATQGPNLYMLARSLERPEMGPNEILNEYYQAFGKAGNQIKEYFGYWKKISDGVSDKFYQESGGGDWGQFIRFAPKLFTDEVMREGFRILKKAKEASIGDELSEKRVSFLEKGLTNAQLALKARKAREMYQMGGLRDEYQVALKQLDDFRRSCEQDLIGNMAVLTWEDGLTYGLRDSGLKSSVNENLKEISGFWKFNWDEGGNGEKNGWYKEEFDDSSWYDIGIRAFWGDQNVGNKWKEKYGSDYLGVAWYRKHFFIPSPSSSRIYRIIFGAVDEACKIWVNGTFVLDRPYPYQGDKDSWKQPFEIDITRFVRYDKPNTVVVKVDNLAGAGGIWKNVWLEEDVAEISENNLMPNPGFEEKTEPWKFHVASGKCESGLDSAEYFSGHSSAFINCNAFALNSENATNPEDKSWARWYQIISVEKGRQYQLSLWVKISTEFSSSGGTVGIWTRGGGEGIKSVSIHSTGGLWEKVVIKDITPGENKCYIYLNSIGGRGKVWFDDVEVIEVSSRRSAPEPREPLAK